MVVVALLGHHSDHQPEINSTELDGNEWELHGPSQSDVLVEGHHARVTGDHHEDCALNSCKFTMQITFHISYTHCQIEFQKWRASSTCQSW